MKPIALATIGVRLIGVALVACGTILIPEYLISDVAVPLPLVDSSLSDLRLHDTSYVVTGVQSGSLVRGVACLLVGALLLSLSRRIAGVITRNIPVD